MSNDTWNVIVGSFELLTLCAASYAVIKLIMWVVIAL